MRHSTHAWRLRFFALLALSLGLSESAEAQDARSGHLEGRVLDSARARPIVGARVVAVGPDAQQSASGAALTDTSGKYHIDSLAPGRYMVGFESSLLDSLDITLAPRQVVIAPGQTATIDLGLPPAPKLRAALCPGIALPPQTGVIYGHVVDTETEGPLPDVVLAMSWVEHDVDRASLGPVNRERSASATTDARGWYRLCGVPTDMWLSLQLQHMGRTGPVIRALVEDSVGLAVRHFSFDASTSSGATDSLASRTNDAVVPPATGTAMLSGIVRGSGDAPLASVNVGVRGTGATGRTDALGHYSLRGLPAGTQMLDVRHLGHEPAEISIELRSGVIVTRDVRLRRIVTLDSVRVVAQRSPYREFNELVKDKRFGIFIGPDEMEWRKRVTSASDVIDKIPGFRITGKGWDARVGSSRGVFCLGKPTIVVDGFEKEWINDVPAGLIGAIAAYPAGEHTPGNYDRGCGAILIWTKR
ncbi:MAG: carboxypeptidase-like regulatory domain-containing protein [Gemmatimonadota bacterium]|nr:carboxypeptidase-like regulatory domain-containing protein [Gemmatimonadota bacterium]